MRLPLENGLLFVHMPKTAGTSFREALEKALGQENMYYDYGIDSDVRSELILEYLHPVRRMPELGEVLAEKSHRFCLAGHFALPKFSPLFLMQNIIMYLREPVQRFISSYEHHKRFNGLEMSLEAYCSEPKYLNVQSRVLGNVPVEMVGFVGLQACYPESLAMFQQLYGIRLEEVVTNVFEGKAAPEYKLDDEMLAVVKKANQREIAVYERAEAIYKQRQALFAEGKHYTHGVLAKYEEGADKVSGWAVNMQDNKPVELEVLRNGLVEGRVVARIYRPGLRERNFPRHGYAGFDLKLKSPLTAEDKVECRVVETGQFLLGPQGG